MGKDIFQLEMIVQYCKDIEDAIERFGNDIEDYIEDKHYQNLCSFYINQIGENIKNVSARSKERYSEILWTEISKVRDDIAHKYHKVDSERIWYMISEEIPKLKETCEKILEEIRTPKKKRTG